MRMSSTRTCSRSSRPDRQRRAELIGRSAHRHSAYRGAGVAVRPISHAVGHRRSDELAPLTPLRHGDSSQIVGRKAVRPRAIRHSDVLLAVWGEGAGRVGRRATDSAATGLCRTARDNAHFLSDLCSALVSGSQRRRSAEKISQSSRGASLFAYSPHTLKRR